MLDLNDYGEFILESSDNTINISKILDNIYKQDNKLVYIEVRRDGKLIFEEDGGLVLREDDQGVLSYFVCSMNLSKLLFYETENYLDIEIVQRGNRKRGKAV